MADLGCIITATGALVRPPWPGAPLLLATNEGGLATELGLTQLLHPAYSAEADAAKTVLRWLKDTHALGDPTL